MRGLVWIPLVLACLGCSALTPEPGPVDVPVLQHWQGDYPVSALAALPAAHRDSGLGLLESTEQFAPVWAAFSPAEPQPPIDFGTDVVVYVRNTVFYNRLVIGRVRAEDGVAEVLAMETLSARPIEDRVAMALAVIPRAGLRAVRVGDQRVPLVAE